MSRKKEIDADLRYAENYLDELIDFVKSHGLWDEWLEQTLPEPEYERATRRDYC